MADKDVAAMIPTLGTFASSVITTAVGHERSANPTLLAELATTLLDVPVRAAASTGEALELARHQLGENGAILAIGSLYLAGDIRTQVL